MKKPFKYQLDKSSKKFNCPSCGKKTFVRFIDSEKNYHPNEDFGRCDREHNCGYMLAPKEDNKPSTMADFAPRRMEPEKPTSFVTQSYVTESWGNYKFNPLTLWLVNLFGDSKTVELIKKYRFGVDATSVYTKAYTIFWQIDKNNKVRSGKMIKYNNDGHRDKDAATTWFHKKQDGGIPVFKDFNLKQCLFGEHLIPLDVKKPIAIVESEKTAIIASQFIPKYIWMACGGKGELSRSKMNVLRNRHVTLFPDLGAYDDWKIKAREFGFNISNHIEKIASDEDRIKGLDIADFLIR